MQQQQQQHQLLLPVTLIDDDDDEDDNHNDTDGCSDTTTTKVQNNTTTTTKIVSFACTVPLTTTMIDDSDDYAKIHLQNDLFEASINDPLHDGNHNNRNDDDESDDMNIRNERILPQRQQQQQLPLPPIGNYGTIVGTITFLGRNTVMIWISWGRSKIPPAENTSTSKVTAGIGTSSNCMMGPLVVSMSQQQQQQQQRSNGGGDTATSTTTSQYRGAFAYDIPSSKLIPSDVENDILATQISERLSMQLQQQRIAIFVSCQLLDGYNNSTTDDSAILSTLSMEQHMYYRRRAIAMAEQVICERVRSVTSI